MRLDITELDINKLCDFVYNARELDLQEVYHATLKDFAETPIEELKDTMCLYDEDTNEVYAIWGVSGDTAIWMLCTYRVEEHPIAFLRFCKEYLKGLLDTNPYLFNYVWLGNDLHVKWLKWMGATFCDVVVINHEPFQYFYFKKKKKKE